MMTPYDECKSIQYILNREIDLLPFGTVRPRIYEYPREAEDIDNCVTSRFGVTEDGTPVVEFYTSIIEQVLQDQESFIRKKYSGKMKYIQTIVRHEYRHLEQYLFCKEHNIDLKEFSENPTSVLLLEKDAYDFEQGRINDLHELFER